MEIYPDGSMYEGKFFRGQRYIIRLVFFKSFFVVKRVFKLVFSKDMAKAKCRTVMAVCMKASFLWDESMERRCLL